MHLLIRPSPSLNCLQRPALDATAIWRQEFEGREEIIQSNGVCDAQPDSEYVETIYIRRKHSHRLSSALL